MTNSLIKKILLLSVLTFVFPLSVGAQIKIDLGQALNSELNVEVIPTYPKPNSTVFIQLEMYSEDLDKAEITWNQDNKVFVKGNGRKSYSFQTGNSGTETNIEVRVKLETGKTFYKKITIKPVGVDLVWQSDSYVPTFYKGKALHPKQGNLRIVAMPDFKDSDGKPIPPEKLIYKWSDGNSVYDNESGYGKNVLNIEGSILGRANRVEVLVTSPLYSGAATGIIDIGTTNPEVLFYEVSPFYGPLFNRALQNTVDLKGEEMEVLAAPFYASGSSNGTLKSVWKLNNQRASGLEESRTIVFRKPEDKSGLSSIQFSIDNQSKILQSASGSFNIKF